MCQRQLLTSGEVNVGTDVIYSSLIYKFLFISKTFYVFDDGSNNNKLPIT